MPERPSSVQVVVAAFARGAGPAVRAHVPALAPDVERPDYHAGVERRLREASAATGNRAEVALIDPAELVAFAGEQGLDPTSPDAQSGLAVRLAERGRARPWPPGRNAPCWCGSQAKHKRCCGAS